MTETKQPEAAVAMPDATTSPADVNVTEVKPHKTRAAATSAAGKPTSGYQVLCCGNSARDLLIIPLCLAGVYALTGALFALCTRAVLQTDDTATALWLFFGVYVVFIAMLGLVLIAGAYEKRMLQAHADDDE